MGEWNESFRLSAFTSNRNYVDRGIIAGASTSIQVCVCGPELICFYSISFVYLSSYKLQEVICTYILFVYTNLSVLSLYFMNYNSAAIMPEQ